MESIFTQIPAAYSDSWLQAGYHISLYYDTWHIGMPTFEQAPAAVPLTTVWFAAMNRWWMFSSMSWKTPADSCIVNLLLKGWGNLCSFLATCVLFFRRILAGQLSLGQLSSFSYNGGLQILRSRSCLLFHPFGSWEYGMVVFSCVKS